MKNIRYTQHTLVWILNLAEERMHAYTLGRIGKEGNVFEGNVRHKYGWEESLRVCVCVCVFPRKYGIEMGEGLKWLALQQSQ